MLVWETEMLLSYSGKIYDNRETPLAGNFVGRCQGHKSDVWENSMEEHFMISLKIEHFFVLIL